MPKNIIKLNQNLELNLTHTNIMGILNVTPDSFHDGNRFNSIENGLEQAIKMQEEGADIIDVGGESTRPGSQTVEEAEELKRVIPTIKAIRSKIHLPISIDTYKIKVAEQALKEGVNIINDVWGLQKQPDIAKVASEHQVPVIIMHNNIDANYQQNIIDVLKNFFNKSIDIAMKAGIKQEKIILDPGIGFSKNLQHNLEIILRLNEIIDLGFHVLLGLSRKSIIGNIINLPTHQRLEGTIALNALGIKAGVKIIRVHDVRPNLLAAKVIDAVVSHKINK